MTELLMEPDSLVSNRQRASLGGPPSCCDDRGPCSERWTSASRPPAAMRVVSELGNGRAAMVFGTNERSAMTLGVCFDVSVDCGLG